MDAPTERELIRRAKRGDDEAMNELIQHHTPFVERTAFKLAKIVCGLWDVQDLVQEGLMALAQSVLKLDLRRKTRLTTFAGWCVRGAMLDYLRNQQALGSGGGRKGARHIKKVSLDAVLAASDEDDGRDLSIEGVLGVCDAPTAVEHLQDFAERLRGVGERERTLLMLYYVEDWPMKRIGAALGMSESRVSQLHAELLKFLRDRAHNGRIS